MTMKSNHEDALAIPTLPADAAKHYIGDMIVELCEIAENAQLTDIAALLRVTVTAIEVNNRFR